MSEEELRAILIVACGNDMIRLFHAAKGEVTLILWPFIVLL
jgi:hypothetical protein